MDKYGDESLTMMLGLMKVTRIAGVTSDMDAVEYLQQYYDFDDPHDKLFIAKCAKAAKDDVLMILFYQLLTEEEKYAMTRG